MAASFRQLGTQQSEQSRLHRSLLASAGICLALGGLALVWPAPAGLRRGSEAALWLAYAGSILYAHRRLRRGHVARSVLIVGLAALAASLAALIFPVALPELIAVPLAIAVLALIYVQRPSRRRLMLGAQLITGLLVSGAGRLRLGLPQPGMLLFAGVAAAELAMIIGLLWRRQLRLARLLAEAKASNASLQRSYDQLETEMHTRTAELQATESRIRAMNQQLTQNMIDLQQHAYELAVLGDMNDSIQACASTAEAYAVITATMERLFADASGALEISAADQSGLELVGGWGAPARATDAARALRVPLIARGAAFGVLSLDADPEQIGEARQQLIFTVARQIELSLANLLLQEKLRHQSIRDPLTGLFNRRYMEESFEREVGRAGRAHYEVGVLMLDIDHFKRFNDTFGHGAGDLLLRETGAVLAAGARSSDVLCRYGGEEFTIIMPAITRDKLLARAEELRQNIKRMRIEYLGQPLGQITISIGAALLTTHGASPRQVLASADAALYRAKRAGRDCVIEAQVGAGQLEQVG